MVERVSRKDVREMRVGQTRIFMLADKKKISSAKQNIYQLQQEEDMEFDIKPDFINSSVSITRLR